jgi:translation elongation factor EF-G
MKVEVVTPAEYTGSDLRSMSQGRATFTMQFDHYAESPLLPNNDPPFRPAIGMRA